MRVVQAESAIRGATESIESTQKRMSEIEKLSETARKSLEEFQKTVPYRTESEAHAAIGELDRMLNAAQVEIAGIAAKTTAIQKYQGERLRKDHRPLPSEAVARLDMMFIEESIALRGAEARRQMATQLREEANRFVDLKSTIANAPGEKATLAQTLHRAQQSLAGGQGNLPALKQEEPKIPNKVVIYPVKWVDEPAQN
ncbi:MAG: hypothetical protein NTZ17_01815 [Phycisphaerae bacterium]|nr:hypothetical protein [Phycisphaerae bacterium]